MTMSRKVALLPITELEEVEEGQLGRGQGEVAPPLDVQDVGPLGRRLGHRVVDSPAGTVAVNVERRGQLSPVNG